tara:strand:+ start:861 stop:998 length:138 start_codon:yes stop_codon:yes gene_type:complete
MTPLQIPSVTHVRATMMPTQQHVVNTTLTLLLLLISAAFAQAWVK